MAKIITKRQETVLAFIKEHARKRGYPPTMREIAAYLKITSLKAVERHLAALEKKGYIRKTGGISRAIEVVGRSLLPNVRQVPVVGTVRAGGPELAVEGQLSQASPTPSESPSSWPAFGADGQLSSSAQ